MIRYIPITIVGAEDGDELDHYNKITKAIVKACEKIRSQTSESTTADTTRLVGSARRAKDGHSIELVVEASDTTTAP